MSHLPPFTAINRTNWLHCPDTFVLTCFSRSNKNFRWQQTLTRMTHGNENANSFWDRVAKAMWTLARNIPEPRIYLQYVYGTADPDEAVKFDVYATCEWVYLAAIRNCDDPDVRVDAAEKLANLRAHGARHGVLYARPS